MIRLLIKLTSWIITIALLMLAGVLVLSRFNTPFGVRIFSVMSGSMEPAISTGSLILVKSANDYMVGDVVTVRSESSIKNTVTHRIVEKEFLETSERTKYQLKGDANENPDSESVSDSRVLGKVIAQVPYLGRAVAFSQSQLGFMVLIVMPATLIIYNEIMTLKKEIPELLKRFRAKKATTEQNVVDV